MGTWQDYAWAKQGMVFPFLEFMDRFVFVCDFGCCSACKNIWLVFAHIKNNLVQIPGADPIVQDQRK